MEVDVEFEERDFEKGFKRSYNMFLIFEIIVLRGREMEMCILVLRFFYMVYFDVW